MFRVFVLSFIVAASVAYGQQVVVHGKFQSDSLLIGQPVPFSLSASYPKDLQILFPDSTFDFKPYELDSRQYFTTRTEGDVSRDSVVYYLTSFEIDSIQTFRLPVYVVQAADCTLVLSGVDSIFLKQFVEHVPDSVDARQLPLKTNTDYLAVSWMLNYPVLIIGIVVLLVVAIVVWLLFGKRVRRYYAVKKLNRNHYSFLERFDYAVQQVQSGFTPPKAEQALVIWKKYMENLEGKPYTKFTSKEIAGMELDEGLASALKGIDRMIYGGVAQESRQPFSELQNFSQLHFTKKLEEVSHG